MIRKFLPRFEDWEAEKFQIPEFAYAAAKPEPGYQVACLRLLRGLTQEQLAEMLGKNGSRVPSLSFLKRVADALRAKVEVRLVAEG